jgi:hypothetical protein
MTKKDIPEGKKTLVNELIVLAKAEVDTCGSTPLRSEDVVPLL